jgi:ABC-type ATPase involved in cell division
VHLSDLWFIAIAVLWAGYFTLEGFDFGVGILLPVLGRNHTERRVMINAIGPVWDGNEVWLLTAGGATFAAFPAWYAAMFSAFYLPLLLVLVALIIRGVAFGNVLRGIPLNADHNFTGNFFTFLNPYALLGGLATLALFTLHGALFLGLKITGDLRRGYGGCGLRRERRRDRRRHRGTVHRPVPERTALHHQRRLLPDHGQRRVDGEDADGDDGRRGDLPAAGARLPVLDVLGVQEADHRPAGGEGAVGAAARPAAAQVRPPRCQGRRMTLRCAGFPRGWPGGDLVLRDVSLSVAAGERVAVTGPSGCGKTTLAMVLPRFLEPASGTVSLGGADIASARLLSWVDALPLGLATPVGEHGARLSGGQRQRLALARVLLADFPVVILDEPAEHLDTRTAGEVTRDLLEAVAGRTILLITHRPVNPANSDRIV